MNKIVIQYQTYQVLTNKNSLNKMNRQLRKIETPQNQTTLNTEQTLTQEQKVNQENFKRIMNREKITLLSLRNIEWRTIKTKK